MTVLTFESGRRLGTRATFTAGDRNGVLVMLRFTLCVLVCLGTVIGTVPYQFCILVTLNSSMKFQN